MKSIDTPFTISVDGKPAGSPTGDEPRTQVQAGEQPAVFSLKDGRLESQGWFLGRWMIEDLSLQPKRVYWFKADSAQDHTIQQVEAVPNGDSFDLKFAGAPLVLIEGKLFATLLGEQKQPVKINLQ